MEQIVGQTHTYSGRQIQTGRKRERVKYYRDYSQISRQREDYNLAEKKQAKKGKQTLAKWLQIDTDQQKDRQKDEQTGAQTD